MSISVDFTNKHGDNNKERLIRIENTAIERPPVNQDSDNGNDDNSNSIDSFLSTQEWITPYEYYSSLKKTSSVSSNKDEGFYNVAINGLDVNATDEVSYFWLEDFKNWARFIYAPDVETHATNTIMLAVWNGKDNWIHIPNFIVGETHMIQYSQFADKYGIAKYQQPLIDKARCVPKDPTTGKYISGMKGENEIFFQKGWCQAPYKSKTGKWISPSGMDAPASYYFNQISFLTNVRAIRLQKNVKYTINKPDTFITNRWSSVPYYYKCFVDSRGRTVKDIAAPLSRYTQTNFSIPVSTGVPCLWRLPTGEIALCATFVYASDPGSAYHYEYHSEDTEYPVKFRKIYDNIIDEPGEVQADKLLGEDTKAASKWLNESCASFFGDGKDKTIENDWLREYKITESNNTSVSNYNNMLDSDLSFEQHNINKENSMKCSFTVNRPVVTTETVERVDYAKKW